MTLAGLSPAGALIVRAGEPFALQVGYVDEDGDLLDLTGRIFMLAIRYTDQTQPLLTIDAELDGQARTAVCMGTAGQASEIYGAGLERRLSYDFMEMTSGATASRLTERVAVQPGSDVPGGAIPQYMDLPMLAVTVAAQRKLVIERGRPGFGAERRLYDAGLIDAPSVEKMDERYFQAGVEGARPFAERAEQAKGAAVAAAEKTVIDSSGASAARDQAEAAAQTALLGGNVFADKAAGEAATAEGLEFTAYGPEGSYATRYLMVDGRGVAQDSYPNRTGLDAAVIVKTGPSLGRVPGSTRKATAAISGGDGRIKSITADDGRSYTPGDGGDFAAPATIRTGPSRGRVPGSRALIRGALHAADGRSVAYHTDDGPFEPTPGGIWARQGQALRGPSLGRLPGSKERAAFAGIDPLTRQVVTLTGDGAERGVATQLVAGPNGLIPTGGDEADPVTFDAMSTTIPVQAGSVTLPGYDRKISWDRSTVTSPAIAPVDIADEVVAAGVNTETWLTYETILAVTSFRRVSDNAPMVEGVDWSLAYDRGIVRNLTGDLMRTSYTAAPQRKSRISVETRAKVGPAVPTITLGPVKARNAHLYLPALPAGHVEIALELHKGTHGILIPRWRWRDRVHLARLAEYQAQRSYNRRILAPIVSALQSSRRVCVVGHGNSRWAHGAGGDMTKLNTRPNSHKSSDPTNDWIRDYALGYYATYKEADMAACGYAEAQREVFDTTPGFNLAAGTADGHGAVHIKAGAVWNMLKELHRAYPKAEIAYLNFGVPGTTSGVGAGGAGNMNALNPVRWDAVQQAMQDEKDAHPDGEILFIPIDPMNELGSTQSYANWRELVSGAQAIGAIPHFMGLSRPDTRFSATAAADADFSAAEMCRAAYDSGSAFSDGLRMLSPENLASIGLCEDEIAQATLQNHDGVTVEIANGLDAAAPYF